jgi:hypothetical protein
MKSPTRFAFFFPLMIPFLAAGFIFEFGSRAFAVGRELVDEFFEVK